MKGVLRVESSSKRKRDDAGDDEEHHLLGLLRKHFGHATFRGKQLQAIRTVLSGRDCFCLMPTGGGKSICYEIAALAKPGIVLVVSPLIALMEDQVAALRSHHISAEFLSSTQPAATKNKVYAELESGSPSLKLLYATPELVSSSFFMGKLRKLHGRGLLSLVAVDEAHCISSWGHDFRPSYRKLSALKSSFPDLPILALTATASKRVRDDVVKSLSLQNPSILLSSFNRPNIFYEVRYKDLLKSPYDDLLELLTKTPSPCSIIYCHARATCDEIGSRLQSDGVSCRVYHAGISDKCRSEALKDWASGKVPVIVATVAFGMGIDRKDVRLVCHFNMPKSLEAFYQESGRAGRDGDCARSIMYYGVDDRKTMEFVIRSSFEKQKPRAGAAQNRDSLKNDLEAFQNVISYCEEAACRRCKLLEHFGERVSSLLCGKSCDVCKSPTRVAADLSELQLVSSTAGAFPPSLTNSFQEEKSEFWSYENEDDHDEEPAEGVHSSDGEEKQLAAAAASKGGARLEKRVAALVRAEQDYYDKHEKKKNAQRNVVSQELREGAVKRLANSLKAAAQRLGSADILADTGAVTMEEDCFHKYGRTGRSFYNSQVASTVRWLSVCSQQQLKTRLNC